MAFQAGNKARKKDCVQDTISNQEYTITDVFHKVVGEFTHDVFNSVQDRLFAATYLYQIEHDKDKLKELVEQLKKEQKCELLTSAKDYMDEDKPFKGSNYWEVVKDKVGEMKKNMIDITEYSYNLLIKGDKEGNDYCFKHIISKIFAGDTTNLVAYPCPINSELKLEDDEKELLIDINNFKCSFMEETLGSLYLKTKIILSDLKPAVIVDKKFIVYVIQDKLGFYTKRKLDIIEPEVWLLLKEIEEESKRLGYKDKRYMLAKVYIHEMMHRYFDMHPELLLKKSVKEIEEPMAEFATIKFCEEFCKDHIEHNELLNVAKAQTKSLRSGDNYIYALGGDLYDFKYSVNLVNNYRHICMLMHEKDSRIQDYLNLVSKKKSNTISDYICKHFDEGRFMKYKAGDKDVAKVFCDGLENCIDEHII